MCQTCRWAMSSASPDSVTFPSSTLYQRGTLFSPTRRRTKCGAWPRSQRAALAEPRRPRVTPLPLAAVAALPRQLCEPHGAQPTRRLSLMPALFASAPRPRRGAQLAPQGLLVILRGAPIQERANTTASTLSCRHLTHSSSSPRLRRGRVRECPWAAQSGCRRTSVGKKSKGKMGRRVLA